MSYLKLIQVLISLANNLIGYAKDKQLLDAGEAKAISKNLAESSKGVSHAIAIRRSIATRDDAIDELRRPKDDGN